MYKKQKDIIYKQDWDILIILDACRVDMFETYSLPIILKGIKFDRVNYKYERVVSEGTCTIEWFVKTFDKELKNVVYLSNNPIIGKYRLHVQSRENFKYFQDLIECFNFSYEPMGYGLHFRPEHAFDTLLKCLKKSSNLKFIIHLYQPHAPYVFDKLIAEIYVKDFFKGDVDFWKFVQQGLIPIERVVKAYIKNLLFVTFVILEYFPKLKNLKILISSDHGELFGEHGFFNHPCPKNLGKAEEIIKLVPLLELTFY